MGSKLGEELRSIRKLRDLSLKAVAEPAGISTAYLQKIETGDVQNPSPNVLYRLAQQLDVSYAGLMELAGYVVPADAGAGRPLEQAFNSEDLTDEEHRAVAAFISHLREHRKSTGD